MKSHSVDSLPEERALRGGRLLKGGQSQEDETGGCR